MDPSRNQFFPNNFQGNISNQLNHLNQGSNVNLMETLSQLSNLANSNLNSAPIGQDVINRGYLSQNLGNQYLNNGGINNGLNWSQAQGQDWLDTAKVAAMYNIIQNSVNPSNVNNQFGTPANFLSTPSSSLFNPSRVDLPSIPSSEMSMFSNQSSASLTPNMPNSLAENGFGNYNFSSLPSTSVTQPCLPQHLDTEALNEFLDLRPNDFITGGLANNLQDFSNSTSSYHQEAPSTSHQAFSYNNLPTTYSQPVDELDPSIEVGTNANFINDQGSASYHVDGVEKKIEDFGPSSSGLQGQGAQALNDDINQVDLLDLADKLSKYEEDMKSRVPTNNDEDYRSNLNYFMGEGSPVQQGLPTSSQVEEVQGSLMDNVERKTSWNSQMGSSEEEIDMDNVEYQAEVASGGSIPNEFDQYSHESMVRSVEKKNSQETNRIPTELSSSNPNEIQSSLQEPTEGENLEKKAVEDLKLHERKVVSIEPPKEEEADQTGNALMDFLNDMAGGTERDSPEPMNTSNPSFEPVQFTPPDSPTAPAAPSFPQNPSFTAFPTFNMPNFAPSTSLEPQPSSSKLVSFLPEVKNDVKESLFSNNMFEGKKNEAKDEMPKKIPIYKQNLNLEEEKEDKKKSTENVYDFDEDEFSFDPKPSEPKIKKEEPKSHPKPAMPTSVYNPVKPKTHNNHSHSKTKPLKIKIRPIEVPEDNITCMEALQKDFESSSDPIKISPFGDLDITVNPTPKAWRWDSDPNENTKLEVVVKEEEPSERPSLKLTIKMTKKEPTTYFEEPEEKLAKKRKRLSESDDEEDEYLPSTSKKHKRKKKRRMSLKEIDPLEDIDKISQCSSSDAHPISVRRNSIIDPLKCANLLDEDTKFKYLALERTESNTKGDFVVEKNDLIDMDPEDICLWRIEKQVKLKFEPCEDEFSGLYAMTDHYAVWYDEMMSNCVKVNCEYISQAKNNAIVKPLYPLAKLFSAVPIDAEETVPNSESVEKEDSGVVNDDIEKVISEGIEILIKEAVYPGFLIDNNNAKSLLQPLYQLIALKDDVFNNYTERFEILLPLKDKILTYNQMVKMNENESYYGAVCENCESDGEITMFHLYNTPRTLSNAMNKEEEEDSEDEESEELVATTLVLCDQCKDHITNIHAIKHCCDHLLDECRREVVGMCLNSPTKWQKVVHKEMINNKIFIQNMTKKYSKILETDIE